MFFEHCRKKLVRRTCMLYFIDYFDTLDLCRETAQHCGLVIRPVRNNMYCSNARITYKHIAGSDRTVIL